MANRNRQWFNRTRITSIVLLAAFSLNAYSDVPKTAEIAKIYNIRKAVGQTIDVRYYRKNECDVSAWCIIRGEGDYLKARDYLQTGEVSRADLALMFGERDFSEVLFWQQEGSRSQFEPQPGTCHFRVDIGGFIYAHPRQSANPGCEKIFSNNALILPHGTALFIEADQTQTLVGVLSNGPSALVEVHHLHSSNLTRIGAGEYAKALPDGKLETGLFSLSEFYRSKPVALGLGPDEEDEDYVRQQQPEIREILEHIRRDTISALEEQLIVPTPSPTITPAPAPSQQTSPNNGQFNAAIF